MKKIGKGASVVTMVRLSPSTREALEEYCAANNESLSAVIRRLVVEFVGRQLEDLEADPLLELSCEVSLMIERMNWLFNRLIKIYDENPNL